MFRKSDLMGQSSEHSRISLPIVDERGNPCKPGTGFAEGSLQPPGSILKDAYQLNEMENRAGTHSGVQHIGFKLYTEEFLLPVTCVREIVMLHAITYVPNSEACVEGIIALRGEIMPVMNLRRLLNFQPGVSTPSTRVVILQTDLGSFGVIVDEITEFVWLESGDIESIAQNFFSAEYKVLSGVAKVGERVRGIIDVSKILMRLVSRQEAV